MTLRTYFILFCLGLTSTVFAQIANDSPCDAIVLNVETTCTSTTFSNAMAMVSGIPDPGCGNYNGGDAWFSFVMPDNGYHVTLEMGAIDFTDAGMAVYSGASCSTLSLVNCDFSSGGNMPLLRVDDGCNFSGAGQTFWVRIWENGNDNNGDFDLCAYIETPVTPPGTASCSGNIIPGNSCCDAVLLTDIIDGFCGNTGNYTDIPSLIPDFCGNIENNSWIAFEASASTVEFDITSSNCRFGDGIQAAVFETTDCSNFTRVSNCYNPTGMGTGRITSLGLTPGSIYYLMIDGDLSDSCDYSIDVISGIQSTNAMGPADPICRGQSANLTATASGTGPFSYAWSPAGTLDDPTSATPVATPNTTTTYTVDITTPTGVRTHSVTVVVQQGVPTNASISGPGTVCEDEMGTSYQFSADNAESISFTVTSGNVVSSTDSTAVIDWTSNSGTICIEATNACGTATPVCRSVNVLGRPDITAQNPPVACAPDGVDLTSVTVMNSGTGGGFITYHASEAAAQAGTPFLPNTNVTSSGTYWIRMQSASDCYDVTSVNVIIEDPRLTVIDPGPTCAPNTIDLDVQVLVVENNGFPGGAKTYFTDSLEAINNTNELTNSVVSTGGTYWVRYNTPNGCPVVASINVAIDPGPAIPLTFRPAILCQGGMLDLDTLTIPDPNNATIDTKNFYANQSLANLGITTLAMTNTVVGTGSYWVRMTTPQGCFAITEIIVEEHLRPAADFSGGGTVCVGDSIDLLFILSGMAPFTIDVTDGTNTFTFDQLDNGQVRRVQVNGPVTYSISSVTDQTGCPGFSAGNTITADVHPVPTATISGGGDICRDANASITFNFTGRAPFDVEYEDDLGNPYTLTGVFDGHIDNVPLNSDRFFYIVSFTDANGCEGTFTGDATFNVSDPLMISNVQENCNPGRTAYTVSFEISGGDLATYAVSGAGTLVGNVFTSDPITSGVVYNFTVTDNSGCPSVMTSGLRECDCNTSPGTMDMTMMEVCDGVQATAIHNRDEVLETGDLLQFAIHDNPGTTLGTVYATAAMPAFEMQVGMNYGTTYYISAIAGPNNGSGTIDQTHKCFGVASGTPVRFNESPEVTISGDATLCPGDSTDLLFTVAQGQTPFTIVLDDGTQQITLSDVADGSTFRVGPTTTTTYSLISVVDETSAMCLGAVSGSATITVSDFPVASNVSVNCNATNTQYQVTFELTGGNVAGYSVAGGGNLDATTNIFTSDFINSGTAYSFSITDGSGCPPVVVDGNHVCDCTTAVGTMSTTTLNICGDELAIATYDNTAEVLDGNDVLGYILHDQSIADLGTIFFTNDQAEFAYDPSLTYGTTYYISAVVANDDGSGAPVLDPPVDPCLAISAGQPVVFYPIPTAAISGGGILCEGDSLDIVFTLTGLPPYNITYTDGQDIFTLNDIQDGHTISVQPPLTTTYTVLTVSGGSDHVCDGTIDPLTESTLVEVIDVPEIIDVNITCNNEGTAYFVSFGIQGGDPAQYQIAGDTMAFVNGNSFTSGWYVGGATYYLELTDGSGCPPVILTATEFCNCTPDIQPQIFTDQFVSCFGDSDAALSVESIGGIAPYSFAWSTGETSPSINNLSAGTYMVTMTDGNLCRSVDTIEITQPDSITANFIVDPLLCYGDNNGRFTFTDVRGGNGQYSYTLNGNTSVLDSLFFELAPSVYTAVITDQNGCSWTEDVTVEEPDQLMVDLGENPEIQLGDSAFIQVIPNMDIDSFVWLSTTGPCTDCLSFFTAPESTTSYRVKVFTSDGCSATGDVTVVVQTDVPVYIPSAFTPDGNGVNDRLTVYGGIGVERILNFSVFDRWGANVFESGDFAPNDEAAGWNGRVKEREVSMGVYVYYAEVLLIDGSVITVRGDATLIR